MAIQLYQTQHPTELPVSVAEAKDEVELIGHAHDAKLARKIGAAREIWERHTKRASVSQKWRLIIESEFARDDYQSFVGGTVAGAVITESQLACRRVVELPWPPIVSVDQVQSRTSITDDWADVDADDYVVDLTAEVGRVTWKSTATLPPFRQIDFTAGYETGNLPADAMETILKLVVFLFENRGDVESKIPTAIMGELQSQATGTRGGYYS